MPPAKKFVPRQRKHKVRAREEREAEAEANRGDNGGSGEAMVTDSNIAEILPEEARARNEKKAQLRVELRAGQATQMSAKKAKRLEKYIETKLRKDESRDLNDKLAAKAIDSAVFESSRDLGKGKRRRRAEMEKQRSGHKGKENEEDSHSDEEDEEYEGYEDGEDDADAGPVTNPLATISEKGKNNTAPGNSLFGSNALAAGSGLKRPLDVGDDGRPILQKRKKRGGVKSKFEVESVSRKQPAYVMPMRNYGGEVDDEDADEWSGFSDTGGSAVDKEEEEEEKALDSDSDDSSDDEGGSDNSGDDDDDQGPRKSAFKAWAEVQRNEALGFRAATSDTTSSYAYPTIDNFQARPEEFDPLPASLQPTTRLDRKAFHVDVLRSPEIESARMALPVVAEEQQIIEAIHEHDVVVLSGGTGSGKTTQVPQFLYEAGYGNPDSDNAGIIGVTQPRRVAAVSMAKRVADELGPIHGRAVAYQIRFETTVSSSTAIKFMTDGVLLRELSEDVALRKYSAVIVDEAHERSINTDVLIGIASRVNSIRAELNQLHVRRDGWYYEVMYGEERQMGTGNGLPRRHKPFKPLKIIIMSATLQVAELAHNERLFPQPPRLLHVEGRQYPVTVHFSQKTCHDYIDEAFRKIVRGHRKLPPGGFLVFLTGEDEIQRLAKRLRLEINGVHAAAGPKVRLSTSEVPYETEDIEFGGGLEDEDGRNAAYLKGEQAGIDDEIQWPDDDYDSSDADDGEGGEAEMFAPDEGETAGSGPQKVHVLPLFSKLSTKDQQRVFLPAPAGMRQVILATNVAETSLTIPGVRYVFDCGRAKARTYNRHTGVQSFEIGWISKASASQRSGRAGRTGPGHCYRLYSSAVYEENFLAFAEPEILHMPIEGVVLQLKAMNVPNIDIFPFPTPPDHGSLTRAERLLLYLSAADPPEEPIGGSSTVSELGQLMAAFPLSPRFAKILMVGHPGGCIHYVIALVAAMSADEVFVRPNNAIPPASATAAAERDRGEDDDENEDGDDPKPRAVRTQDDIRQDEERRRTAELFRKVHRQFTSLDDKADALKLLQVIGEFSHEPTEAWCKGHFVHYKALREIQKMRRQITHLLRTNLPVHAASQLSYQEQLPRPTDAQIRLIKQMVAAGFPENVALRADLSPNPPEYINSGGSIHKPRRAIEVPYRTLLPVLTAAGVEGGASSSAKVLSTEFVYIHPSSPMAHLTVAECPQFIVYSHLQRSAPSPGKPDEQHLSRPKVRMRSLTDLTGLQLAGLLQGTPLLTYSKPIKETFRSEDGRERECWVVPSMRADDGSAGLGWPLPAMKIRQRKVPGRGWEVIPRQ